ncbi:hypothetical protein Bca52824_087616 [Brassica carinata]|uniref:Uncharacterized protein n=1 Tax=Brassica carinata TaxID=52824 RepID=A0A8X7PCM5_BRACI|nr:hypothetical protein Bca52824_087616 [Brassica carinata]
MDSSLAITFGSLSRSHSDRSIAVTRLALLRSLVMDSSLVDTWLGSLSRSHSDRSLAVTRLALLRSLDSLFAVTRHG